MPRIITTLTLALVISAMLIAIGYSLTTDAIYFHAVWLIPMGVMFVMTEGVFAFAPEQNDSRIRTQLRAVFYLHMLLVCRPEATVMMLALACLVTFSRSRAVDLCVAILSVIAAATFHPLFHLHGVLSYSPALLVTAALIFGVMCVFDKIPMLPGLRPGINFGVPPSKGFYDPEEKP